MDADEQLALLAALDMGPSWLAWYLTSGHRGRRYHRMLHLDVISSRIAAAERDGHWVMVHTPPQVGKTLTGITWTAFWLLARDPTAEIIITCYNDSYATERGEEVKDLVTRHGSLFGLRLRAGRSPKKDWKLESGGSVYCVGMRGAVTGRTGTRILVDDYLKGREEADSPRIRAKLLSKLGSEVVSRRAPGALVVWLGTLWHEREPAKIMRERYGLLGDGGMWDVIRIPAFADDPDDPLGRPIGAPLQRAAGDRVLTVEEAGEWWREQQRGQNPRDWQALYMAVTSSTEGALMTGSDLAAAMKSPPAPGDIVRECLAVDPADADDIDATDNDRNGIVHVGRDRSGKIWGLGDYSMSGPVDVWTRRVVELAVLLDVDEIVYEKNKGGNAVKSVLASAWRTLQREGKTAAPPPRITPVTATKNKVTRASPVAQLLKTGEAFLAVGPGVPSMSVVGDQLTTYQAGSRDSPDEMDAFVWGVTRMYRPAAARQPATGGVLQHQMRGRR